MRVKKENKQISGGGQMLYSNTEDDDDLYPFYRKGEL